MIQDPDYLIWKDADKRYKQEQQKVAKSAFQDNKVLRKQIKERTDEIKRNYVTMAQANRLGVTAYTIKKRIKDWKLKARVVGDKIFYSQLVWVRLIFLVFMYKRWIIIIFITNLIMN